MTALTSLGIPYPQTTDAMRISSVDLPALAAKIDDLLDHPACKLILPSNFAVANNNNTVTIPFGAGSEARKTHAGMHSTTVNNTRIIPTKPGDYWFYAVTTFAVDNTGFRTHSIGKNGVRQDPEAGIYNSAALPSGANATLPPAGVLLFANGLTDYFELFAFQNRTGGTALNVVGDGTVTNTGNTQFGCFRVTARTS